MSLFSRTDKQPQGQPDQQGAKLICDLLLWRLDLLVLKSKAEKDEFEKGVYTRWGEFNRSLSKDEKDKLIELLTSNNSKDEVGLICWKLGSVDVYPPPNARDSAKLAKSFEETWRIFINRKNREDLLRENVKKAAQWYCTVKRKDNTIRDAASGTTGSANTKDEPDDIDKSFTLAPKPSVSKISTPNQMDGVRPMVQNNQDGSTIIKVATETAPQLQKPLWNYNPVPDDPDKHDEHYSKSSTSDEGFKIIGARVRGKKHKHDGTNCDDWFEYKVSGSWTIIAVSDGAGSKKLSRVGAKLACETAAGYLFNKLERHKLDDRDIWNEVTRNSSTGDYDQPDIEYVQTSIHDAMREAHEALNKKVDETKNYPEYFDYLGNRVPDIKDFSATLLIAVHTVVNHGKNPKSFVMTCQVGDGMIAAIATNSELNRNELSLLAIPDTGSYGGETDFITSANKLEKGSLVSRTFLIIAPLSALLVMTDGVADDYFPNNPGILNLYGDLVLNRIIDTGTSDSSKIKSSLLPLERSVEDIKKADLSESIDRITGADSRTVVKIKSIDKYAGILGRTVQEVVESPELLSASAYNDDVEKLSPDKRLENWLDTYYKRGSFDDRSLVILHMGR